MEAGSPFDNVVHLQDNEILFIPDLARTFRTSRSTIERRLRDGDLPVPELLPRIDKRPRWSRRAVEAYLSGTTNGASRRFLTPKTRRRSGGGR